LALCWRSTYHGAPLRVDARCGSSVLFNSLEYLVFLPIVLVGFFLIPVRFRWIWLLGASWHFYASWSAQYLLLFVANTFVAYLAGLGLGHFSGKRQRRLILGGAVSLLLGTLFVFKYLEFFRHSLEAAFVALGAPVDLPEVEVVLPVGVSFYTFQALAYVVDVYRRQVGVSFYSFQALAYVVDVYRRQVPVERHAGVFALYKAFFPQLVAGPIERPARLLPALHRPTRLDCQRLASGFALVVIGLFKKVVIADRLAIYVNEVYGHPSQYHGLTVVLATYLFAFQIYCDFSGYSDIAIGSARMFGYDLMQNFDRPYFSRSIREFWTRWHISLSTWFRDYVYIPLGGNRVAPWRNELNIFIVFLVSGLWHGASWTFVVWGALHGLYVLFAIWTAKPRAWLARRSGLVQVGWLHATFERLVVFNLVAFAWVFFRADSFADAWTLLGNATEMDLSWDSLLVSSLNGYELAIGIIAVALMTLLHAWQDRPNSADFLSKLHAPLRYAVLYVVIGAIAVAGEFNLTEFIYFQF
jgi:alginate O-acetyltransferase complex protein AlgI